MRIRSVSCLACLVVAVGPTASATVTRVGTSGNDVLPGTSDNDQIYGLGGNDVLHGRAGRDDLDGGPGADDLRGGAGLEDAVSYDGATRITVTLDDKADDGRPGEQDNVHRDVEAVYGSDGDDAITGSRVRNTIDGGLGDDLLRGSGGHDFLFGGFGDDAVDARDREADAVDCGQGRDLVAADTVDLVRGNCENRADRLPRRGHVLAILESGFGVPPDRKKAKVCHGRVRVTLLRRERPLARATTRLDRNCEVHRTFELAAGRVGTARTLRARLFFTGTPDLGAYRWTASVEVVRLPG